MSEIAIINQHSNAALEDYLSALSRYGNPRLSKQNNGWYCIVEMFVSGSGVQFDVKSEFGNPTPKDAAKQCLTRMSETLLKYGVKA